VAIPVGLCECGCGDTVIQKRKDYLPKFIVGHYSTSRRNKPLKPQSRNVITCRARAQKLITEKICHLRGIGGCVGRIEVHHIDGIPINNDLANLIPLCVAHHRLVENGHINLNDPIMPEYRLIGGNRKYGHRANNGKIKIGVWVEKDESIMLKKRASGLGLSFSDYLRVLLTIPSEMRE
jgi:hypothetical protein